MINSFRVWFCNLGPSQYVGAKIWAIFAVLYLPFFFSARTWILRARHALCGCKMPWPRLGGTTTCKSSKASGTSSKPGNGASAARDGEVLIINVKYGYII